jgi:putative metallohydrolase (TIGR04338 family)
MKRSGEVAASQTSTTKGETDTVASNGIRIRDSQREKVYRSERMVFRGSPGVPQPDSSKVTPDYKTVAECQEYVDYVTASDAWRKVLGIRTEGPVEARDGRGRRRASADSVNDQIKLPKWTRDRWQILHELAHIATDYTYNLAHIGDEDGPWWFYEQTVAPHGPEYAGVYLYLVHEFLGLEVHDKLLSEFENNRVKVHHIVEAKPEPAVEDIAPGELDTESPIAVTDTETLTAATDADTRCLECGMHLSPITPHKFCSDRCRWTYHNRERRHRTADTREKTCEVCSKEFTAARSDAKTCSPKCRQKARRQRTRA